MWRHFLGLVGLLRYCLCLGRIGWCFFGCTRSANAVVDFLSSPLGGTLSGCCLCVLCLSHWGGYHGLVGWPSAIVLDLLIDLWVQCEGNNSSLNVVSFLVYLDAAPGIYGYPECGSLTWGVAMNLIGVLHGIHYLGLFRWHCVLPWPSAPLDCPWIFGIIWGVSGVVCFVCAMAFLPPVCPAIFAKLWRQSCMVVVYCTASVIGGFLWAPRVGIWFLTPVCSILKAWSS